MDNLFLVDCEELDDLQAVLEEGKAALGQNTFSEYLVIHVRIIYDCDNSIQIIYVYIVFWILQDDHENTLVIDRISV